MKNLIDRLKKHIWLVALLAALILGGFGIYRGEVSSVLEKARIICLECIGIG
jgi:hypothetical protein